ncbi:DUF2911 domain-containing protein [Muriicola sp.]|uniref:DUF2911 domain-containing protein n=1 Tax=Muriicola sp. TaxID=2020856 RepID=UPI003C773C5B
MKKWIWISAVLILLAVLFYFVGIPYLKSMPLVQKMVRKSPEQTAIYTQNDLSLSVTYSSPSKRGRVIFGGLVPYNKVWRTGANKPTVFVTSRDLIVMGNTLPAGSYSLWTIPREDNWSVLFNKKIPDWGTTYDSKGNTVVLRDASEDILEVQVPTVVLPRSENSFTIAFENEDQLYLTLYWDTTKVKIPIKTQ